MTTWTVFISIIALVVSIIAVIFNSKSVCIEKKRDVLELEKGKIALYNLVIRYFVINYQRTDFTPQKTLLKKDKYYNSNYITELQIMASQFDNLITTSYYTVLYKKYPMVGVISTFLRKEMMFSYNNPPTYNAYVLKQMFSAFDELQKDTMIKNRDWEHNDIYSYIGFLRNCPELKTYFYNTSEKRPVSCNKEE